MARYTISIHMDEISGQRYPSGKITTDCVYREKIYAHKYKNKEPNKWDKLKLAQL